MSGETFYGGGAVWLANEGGWVACVDPQTGQARAAERVMRFPRGPISPLAANEATHQMIAAGEQGLIQVPTDATQLHGSDRSPQRRPLDQFDEDDNFVATTLMDQYCTRLAETWLGIPAGDLLPGSPKSSSRNPHSQLAIRRESAQNQCAGPSALT
jgi:hypothetical protein